jgi:hypothetical protein
MNYFSIIDELPEELRPDLLRLVEAVQQDMHEQLAQRLAEFEHLQGVVAQLAGAYELAEQRLIRLETVVAELEEAQKRTERRMAELEEAQKRRWNNPGI